MSDHEKGGGVRRDDEYESERRAHVTAPRHRLSMSTPRVVHLELHTRDLAAASTFYGELLDWRTEQIESRWGSYHGLLLGVGLDGGVVECGTPRAAWLPYVEVEQIEVTTDRARGLGASVLLSPREGPAGWRSVVSSPAGGEIALWQPKR